MERETIYIPGDQAIAAAESPRLINSGGQRQELKLDNHHRWGVRERARGGFQGGYVRVDPTWEK